MKKIITILLITVLAVTGIYAHSGFGNYATRQNFDSDTYNQRLEYQNTIYEITQNGTYNDLMNLREESGINYAIWVDSEEDFNTWQEIHQNNEMYGYGNRGYSRGYNRGFGNCMMG